MRKLSPAAGTNMSLPHNPASTLHSQKRRPFLATRPYTSSPLVGQYLGRDPLGDRCPRSPRLKDTPSINTDVWPPSRATHPPYPWRSFRLGEGRGEAVHRSPLVYPQGGGVNRVTRERTGPMACQQGEVAGSTEVMIIDSSRRDRLQYASSPEFMNRRWSAFEMNQTNMVNNDLICPPVSFLSASERFIAQERYLDVQSNTLEAACDFLENMRANGRRATCFRSVGSENGGIVNSRTSSADQNFLLSQTQASQILQKMTIKPLISVKTLKYQSDDGELVKSQLKSDATVTLVRPSNGNDTATSPSSSSPETQVEVYKTPVSKINNLVSEPLQVPPPLFSQSTPTLVKSDHSYGTKFYSNSLDSRTRRSVSIQRRNDSPTPRSASFNFGSGIVHSLIPQNCATRSTVEVFQRDQTIGTKLCDRREYKQPTKSEKLLIEGSSRNLKVENRSSPFLSESEGAIRRYCANYDRGESVYSYGDGPSHNTGAIAKKPKGISEHKVRKEEREAQSDSSKDEEYFVVCFDVKKFDPFRDDKR